MIDDETRKEINRLREWVRKQRVDAFAEADRLGGCKADRARDRGNAFGDMNRRMQDVIDTMKRNDQPKRGKPHDR